jgi:hypothetical protein
MEWRERLAVTTDGQPRREIHSILFAVRGMYRDLAEWSHDEPARWGPWVAPCPVSRHESKAASKAKRHQQSRTQNRTRSLAPLLPGAGGRGCSAPGLVSTSAGRSRPGQPRRAVHRCGTVFELHQPPPRHYERDRPRLVRARLITAAPDLPLIRVNRRGLVDLTAAEASGFWAWAAIETLRHTGIRIEELLGPCWVTSTSIPPAATPRSSLKRSPPLISTSSNADAPPARSPSYGRPPARNGPSSRTTSCCARSPLASATAPTAHHVSTNRPAPGAGSCASTLRSCPESRR